MSESAAVMMTMTMMMMTLDPLQMCQKRYTMSKELRPTSANEMPMLLLLPLLPLLLPLLYQHLQKYHRNHLVNIARNSLEISNELTESNRPIQWLEEMPVLVKKKGKLLDAHQLGRKLSVRPPAMLGWAPSDHPWPP